MLRPAARGFTLVEVLVTVVVLALGLLALAGLQAMSKKSAFEAMQRTTAGVLANDLIARMRSNAAALDGYVVDEVSASNIPTSDQDCAAANASCTAQELAAFDLSTWWSALNGADETDAGGASVGGLTSPVGCVVALGSCRYQVTVAWRGITPQNQEPDPDIDNDPTASTCGVNNSDYIDPNTSATANYRYRRVLVVDAQILNRAQNPAVPCQ
jgi:type IV pilus assembly protein PilV